MSDDISNDEVSPLLLKDLVGQVRKELLEIVAENKKKNTPGIFAVEKVTLEVNVTAERGEVGDGKIGAKLFVVDLSATATKSVRTEHVHKVILELSAHAPRPSEATPTSGVGRFDPDAFLVGDILGKEGGKLIMSVAMNEENLQKIELGRHVGLFNSGALLNWGIGRKAGD
jgi:hypothetical protein